MKEQEGKTDDYVYQRPEGATWQSCQVYLLQQHRQELETGSRVSTRRAWYSV
jgi:hypothetical protein